MTAAAATGLLAACSSPDRSGTTVLEFWAMGREGEVVAELVPEFERTHPGIRVEVQTIPWSAAHEKLLTAFVGNSLPDVAQLGNTWLAEFTVIGALEPLDARVQESSAIEPDDYFPGIWDTNRIEGQLRGVPWYVDTRLLFYRRDLLAAAGYTRPPATWAEWKEMLTAIKRQVGPERYAVFLPLSEFEPIVTLALQQDDGLLRDGGRFGNFRSEGFRHTLAFYLDLFRSGLAPAESASEIANVWNEFARGYFSFYITGPWNIGEFKRRLPPDQQHIWMTAPMPGPDGPGASVAGGSSLVVFAASSRKRAAWQLVEYLSQTDVQRQFYRMTGNLPPRRSAWLGPPLADDVYARAFRDQLERVEASPKVPEWERIAGEMRIVVERAVHHGLSVEQASAELDRRTDRILEKRRWMLARRDER